MKTPATSYSHVTQGYTVKPAVAWLEQAAAARTTPPAPAAPTSTTLDIGIGAMDGVFAADLCGTAPAVSPVAATVPAAPAVPTGQSAAPSVTMKLS